MYLYLNKIRVGFDDTIYRLMRLFEGGILSKITEEEYQKLNDKLMGSEQFDATSVVIEPVLEGSEPRQEDDDKQLTIAMSMKTLQGAFYVLAIGSILAGARSIPQNIIFIIRNFLYDYCSVTRGSTACFIFLSQGFCYWSRWSHTTSLKKTYEQNASKLRSTTNEKLPTNSKTDYTI